MVVCTPCCGLGVRHIQYLLFGVLITLEYWMQEITLKTFMRNLNQEAFSGIGRSTDVTVEEVALMQQIGYSCFVFGRLISGFACLRVNNKYLLLGIVIFEVIVGTSCYWFIMDMRFSVMVSCFAGLGFSRAFHWTLVMNILVKWMPPNEFTTANSIIIVFREFFSLMVKFFIVSANFDDTRRVLLFVMFFYVSWTFVYLVVGAEGPDTSFLLSRVEHAHLAKHIGPRKKTRCSAKVPWKSIFSTPILYGWLIADIGRECSVTTVADGFFVGLKGVDVAPVSGIQVGTAAFYAALLATGVLCDKLITKEVLTAGQVRKIYSSVGSCGASISMILAAYSEKPSPQFAYLIIANLFGAIVALGQPLALFDISPNYAALMFATFTFARCMLYTIKLYVDKITGMIPLTEDTFDIIFYRYGFLVFITNLTFLLFGTIERKPFDAYDTADWTKESIISYP